MAIVNTHNIISNDSKLAPRYFSTQEHVIFHFEDTLRLLGIESQQAFQRIWNILPHNIQICEYHSPKRLRNALDISPMYERAMQRLNINQNGIKLNPPFLLDLQEGRNEEEERKQWEDIKENAGFYPQEGTPSAEPWNVREVTRAMKDMDMYDQVAQRMSNNFSRG